MGREPREPRVVDSGAVHEEEVGEPPEAPEGRQGGRHLPEGEEAGDVGESGLHDPAGPLQDDRRGEDPVSQVALVHAAHEAEGAEVILPPGARDDAALDRLHLLPGNHHPFSPRKR